MAVSVALRNKKLLEAGMDGGGDTTCERCAIGLIRPGRPGETRRINHARVEYILPPSWGGDRTTKNCALLCGQCKDELKFVKERHRNWMNMQKAKPRRKCLQRCQRKTQLRFSRA